MRVLLISPNDEKFPPAFPLGLYYLERVLKDQGYTVQILDLINEDDEKLALQEAITTFKPNFIGFSIRNIDNLVFKVPKIYYEKYKSIIDYTKEITDATIVLGGSGFSILPKELLQYYDVKYGIVGDGERAFINFIEKYSKRHDVRDINGLIINDNGNLFFNKQSYDFDFSNLTFPKRDSKYLDCYSLNGKRWLNIQSKRGCNQGCIYCTSPYLEGNSLRLRDPRLVGDELEYLHKNLNIESIRFVDAIFNFPPQHAIEICQEIINRKLKIEWNAAFSPKIKLLPSNLLTILQASGCQLVDFSGMDTASKIMLKNMRKPFTQGDIINSAKVCKEAGLKVVYSLLLGGPGETIDTIKESLEITEQINPDAIWVNLGIRIYPNTLIEKIAIEEGLIKQGQELVNPKYYISPHLRDVNLHEIFYPYSKSHPNWALTCLANNYSEWVSEIVKYTNALV